MPKTYIIAEAGVNHNGSMKMAKELIDIAAEAKVDAVKFQTFKSENLVSKGAPKAEYQQRLTDTSESQYQMLRNLELTEEDHCFLIDYSHRKGIEFLSTPFDFDSVDLLTKTFNISKVKIASGEITNAPLLLHIARTGKPVILSTGMSSIQEVELALSVLAFGYTSPQKAPTVSELQRIYLSEEGQQSIKEKVTLLHCTSEYPTPFSEVNLQAMDTLKDTFNISTGISDHSIGISVPLAAVARGASIVEKHFTIDKSLPGPDHQASLLPSELRTMVTAIREVELALGSPTKQATSSELKNQKIARKSLVAKQNIRIGERFTEENLAVKRPGEGISPIHYWEWIGKVAEKNYEQDDLIQ
jgi:N-acetylneuraminate synthase